MSETNILRSILLEVGSRADVRLFRNNVGVATFPDGSRVAYGLAPGSSDIIGFKQVTVTPEMVGQKVAIFVAIEVKREKGRISANQLTFIEAVRKFGGIAGIAKSASEALNLINKQLTTTDIYKDEQ